MLNIVILLNTAKYHYHTKLSRMMQSFLCTESHTVAVLDINSNKRDCEYLEKINTLQPDVLITLDLSGFQFRTQAGEIALNMLATKNLNLIWGNKEEYSLFLNKKLSLSMLFYDGTGTDHHLPQKYQNLLYYKAFSPLIHTASTATPDMDQEQFQHIWQDFTQEALLFSASSVFYPHM